MTDIRIASRWSLLPGLCLFGAALFFHRPAAGFLLLSNKRPELR